MPTGVKPAMSIITVKHPRNRIALLLLDHAGPTLDMYSGVPAVERVNTELKKQILQARTGAKMTQAQLAKVCSDIALS